MDGDMAYGPLDHPQRLEGEVYMGRCWNRWSPERDRERGWNYGWRTARLGELEPWTAGDFPTVARRHPREGSLPWFVQEAELAEAGVWSMDEKKFLGEWDDPGYY